LLSVLSTLLYIQHQQSACFADAIEPAVVIIERIVNEARQATKLLDNKLL